MKFYIINLKHRPERLNRTLNEIHKAFPSVEKNIKVFDAINGKTLSTDKLKKYISVRAFRDLNRPKDTHEGVHTLGQIGCSLSHIGVWQDLLNSNDEFCIVLEDDVVFNSDTNIPLEISKLKPYIQDLCFLGIQTLRHTPIQKQNYRLLNGQFFGMHFYLITREGARKALKQAFPIEMHIDSYLSFLIKRGDIHAIAPLTNLSWQDGFQSDAQISGCIKCNLTDEHIYFGIFTICILLVVIFYFILRKQKCR